MGNLARDVLFRMPARDVIRYTLFKVTSIDELDARASSCNDSETALTFPIEYMYPPKIYYWPNIDLQAAIQLIVRELCTLTHAEQFIVCCDTYSFFSKISAPKRERELESCGKWDDHLGEREWNKLMYSDCRGRLQHKGSFGFVQNAEKIVQVACCFFFLTETSNAQNKAIVYLIFTDMPARTHTWSSSLFYSRYITVNFRLKFVWFSGYPTDTPSPPIPFKYFKGFPSSAICPSRVRHGSHFYHSMHVLVSWTQLGP